MELVIDPQVMQQCMMVVGRVKLPLSREQVVEMLFGDGYAIVKRDVGSALALLKEIAGDEYEVAKRGAAKALASAPKRESDARSDRGEAAPIVLKALARGPATQPEIRKAIEAASPQVLERGRPSTFLSNVMAGLVKSGQVKRSGSRGSFVFRLAGAAPPGCTRCGKRVVEGKKLCKEHLAVIRANQKKMVASKHGAHLNGAHAEVTA